MSVVVENLVLTSVSEMFNNFNLISDAAFHVNAAEEVTKFPTIHGVVQMNLNWYDAPLQDINKDGILFHVVKLIDFYIRCGKKVVVNCFAGVSRSTTIVLAYLMYKNKMSVQDAIYFVRSKRPIVNPNYGFVCQLYNLENTLHNLAQQSSMNVTNLSKTHTQLVEEVTTTYEKVPFIKEIQQRELTGFNMPIQNTQNTFFPSTNTSPFNIMFIPYNTSSTTTDNTDKKINTNNISCHTYFD